MKGYSLNPQVIDDIFCVAKPMGHHEIPNKLNLGFGFLYYGLVRVVRPKHVLVIGSGFGFSVICLALGLKDNEKGRLSFVDPSYNVLKDGPLKTFGGRGKWSEPESVNRHFGLFGVDDIVTHYRLRADEFFQRYESFGLPKLDIAFIDGNHSYSNVKHDFTECISHVRKNAYLFVHDTNIYLREAIRNSGVKRWLNVIKKKTEYFEVIDFPFSSGVAIVRVLQNDSWRCLKQ